jgi:hypothetical protein
MNFKCAFQVIVFSADDWTLMHICFILNVFSQYKKHHMYELMSLEWKKNVRSHSPKQNRSKYPWDALCHNHNGPNISPFLLLLIPSVTLMGKERKQQPATTIKTLGKGTKVLLGLKNTCLVGNGRASQKFTKCFFCNPYKICNYHLTSFRMFITHIFHCRIIEKIQR